VKQREAEANMLRAEADGQADAKLKLAEAEAKSIQIRGQAMRENPEVLQLEAINKWNGTSHSTWQVGLVLHSFRSSDSPARRKAGHSEGYRA
jgi:regulator of protease activity HflC (stomatin/prohibitin superfamily)